MEKYVLNGYDSIKINKVKTCCFSGHRPQDLPWGNDENNIRCKRVRSKLERLIKQLIDTGVDCFLCGMALGFDMMCADIVLKLKKDYPNIKLICVLPCLDQERLWEEFEQNKYRYILSNSDWVVCEHEEYFDGCMLVRNNFLVDNSSYLICLYSGKKGGTSYTYDLAIKNGLKIFLINP